MHAKLFTFTLYSYIILCINILFSAKNITMFTMCVIILKALAPPLQLISVGHPPPPRTIKIYVHSESCTPATIHHGETISATSQ